MIRQIPDGVYPTMITPYTADGQIDYPAVKRLLRWYGERGAAGVFAICQSSEIFYLDFEERLSLLRFIMENKPEGMTVVASGHTASDPDTAAEEARAFIETGVDAYVFIANRFASENESDGILVQRALELLDRLPEIGFGVYECPYPYKRVLTPFVLSELSKTGRFLFLKDTCCDPEQIRRKLEAVKDTKLKIFNANAATLLATLRMGCAGYSGVMANFHPELYAALCAKWKTEPALAEALQDAVGFLSVAECQCYPVNAKYYLDLEGLDMLPDSRARDKKEFTVSRQLEIRQMRQLTARMRETFLKDAF